MDFNNTYIVSGPIVHSEIFEKITVIEDGFITIAKGKIVAFGTKDGLLVSQEQFNVPDNNVIYLKNGQFLMPGFIDTHIHAPQHPNAGLGYDKPLLEWLDTYTYPLEEAFNDTKKAEYVYTSVVKRTLKNGTTTACYFATIHLESSLILADVIIKLGQRAFVGKVNMNQNFPDNYGETTQQSLLDTELFIKSVLVKNSPRVQPVITPRFAISCDMPLMKSLGDLAAKYDVLIQTHISENLGEIEFVKELYPDCKNYADVYDQANLLTNKTVLAHGVHLEDAELEILCKRGTSISHCPNSNTSLQSGICNVQRLLTANINVGLGTDISGGYSPSILDAIRSGLTASSHINILNQTEFESLNYHNMFYLATLGGAKALALDNKIGNFIVGKDFDALVITLNNPESSVDILGEYSVLENVQKFLYMGDDRNITQVFVAGNLII